MMTRLVGLYLDISYYEEGGIIGRAIAPPTLPEPTPMYGKSCGNSMGIPVANPMGIPTEILWEWDGNGK